MRRSRILALVLLAAVVALAFSRCGGVSTDGVSPVGSAGGELVLLDSMQSLGEVREGETVECSYRLRNGGEGVLNVTVDPPECACLAVRPMQFALAPGEQKRIRVAFDSRGFSGSEAKQILLRADSSEKVIPLLLVAHVVGGLQWEQ